MLVLDRKLGQSLVIGEAVVIIKKIMGKRITLGIEAPKAVHIKRGELGERQEPSNV